MSGGARKAPLVYEGEYDATRTYLPLRVVHVTDGATRTGYLSTAKTTGDDPATSPTIWLPLGGGGDGEHNGTGTDSTAVGTSALAGGASSTSLGDAANASAARTVALGRQAYAHVAGATAVGDQAEAAGDGAVAIGPGTYVGGDRGIAVGNSASTDADSIAIGDRAEGGAGGNVVLGPVARAISAAATDGGCVIAGVGATAAAADGIAVGHSARTDAEGGLALGPGARAVGLRGIAIGSSVYNPTADTALIAGSYLEIQERTLQQSYLIVTDDVGQRWQVGVDSSGTLTIALA